MSTVRKKLADQSVGPASSHIPSFMPSDPVIGFTLVDLVFENYRITRNVGRFRRVADRLLPDAAVPVGDDTTSSRNYEYSKFTDIPRTDPTGDQLTRQMLQEIELGNWKLSDLLREIRHLRGAPSGDGPILLELWLQRLPPRLAHLLVATRNHPLDEIAEFAVDNISRYSSSILPIITFLLPKAILSSS